MESPSIQYSKNTVGCRVGGDIFLHPKLYKYPKLYHAVLSHEKKHSNKFTLDDVQLDFVNDDLKSVKPEFYKFMLRHPRTFLGWLPLTKIGKHWAFDLQLAGIWLFAIVIAGLVRNSL